MTALPLAHETFNLSDQCSYESQIGPQRSFILKEKWNLAQAPFCSLVKVVNLIYSN